MMKQQNDFDSEFVAKHLGVTTSVATSSTATTSTKRGLCLFVSGDFSRDFSVNLTAFRKAILVCACVFLSYLRFVSGFGEIVT